MIGTGAEVILTQDAPATAERVAAVHAYLSPEQVRSSPKILIGTPDEIAAEIIQRRTASGPHLLRAARRRTRGARSHHHPGAGHRLTGS